MCACIQYSNTKPIVSHETIPMCGRHTLFVMKYQKWCMQTTSKRTILCVCVTHVIVSVLCAHMTLSVCAHDIVWVCVCALTTHCVVHARAQLLCARMRMRACACARTRAHGVCTHAHSKACRSPISAMRNGLIQTGPPGLDHTQHRPSGLE